MPNPQIRRNLTPRQAAGERDANRIPLELVTVYRCHIRSPWWRVLLSKKPEQKRCRSKFIPRIRDLPSKRLYLFDPAPCPKELKGLIGGKIREPLIAANRPDILRSAATLATGAMPPSQLLRKLAAYPRQHELAVALREIGRVERTLFIIDWLLDVDMQRRAQIGLNKGEAHHALKIALRIGRQGEIRDRTSEGQHFRMAGLNLLAAIIIYWNTKHLGHAVAERRRAALDCPTHLLAHISPLGWAHILLTGEYRWPKR